MEDFITVKLAESGSDGPQTKVLQTTSETEMMGYFHNSKASIWRKEIKSKVSNLTRIVYRINVYQ